MSAKIKQNLKSVANLEKSISLILSSMSEISEMFLANHGIVRLVKYCFILEKYANYRTPRKMSIRPTIFGFNLVIVRGKLKRLSPKITLNSY